MMIYFSTGGPAELTASVIKEAMGNDERIVDVRFCEEDDIDAVMVVLDDSSDLQQFADDYDGYWGHAKETFLSGMDEKMRIGMKMIYLAYGLPGQAMADEIMRKEGSVYEDAEKDPRIISAEACDGVDIVKLEIVADASPDEIAEDYAGEWAWSQGALERLLHDPKDSVSDEDRR